MPAPTRYIIKPFDPDELKAGVAVGVRALSLQRKLAEQVAELQAALANVKQPGDFFRSFRACDSLSDSGALTTEGTKSGVLVTAAPRPRFA